ncbi:hypothetical protein HanIR_Chr05g0216261 [Helianthus annuus]|nr:hypothetical protein HanIR_Chr05g0216261 [Helianthus annuus]
MRNSFNLIKIKTPKHTLMCVFWSWFTQEPKRVFIKTLNHKKFSQIKGNQARKLGLLIN